MTTSTIVQNTTRIAARSTAPRTARRTLLALATTALLAGCAPQFHAGTLPGAPADATFVDIDGVHVRYRETGTGPVVVLVHGYGASSDSWLPVIPTLAARHRVIAIDLKGFGWTSRPAGDYSPAAQAQLVWRVLDKLGVGDAALVGHSYGSSVVLSMAVAQPARVRRVALYSAYVYDEQVPGLFRWAEQGGIGELLFALNYKQRLEDRAPLAFVDERWVTQGGVDRLDAEMARPGTVAAALAVARRHQFGALHERLKGFARPVLLLWGEDDQVTPIRFAHRLVGELANATLEVYPRCGHIPMVEAHGPSTRDLVAFVGQDVDGGTDDGGPDDGHPTDGPAAGAARDGDGGGGPGGDGRADGAGGEGDRGGAGRGAGGGADRGAGGGADRGARAATPAAALTAAPTLDALGRPRPGARAASLPIGADLAALGAELTPRLLLAPREHVQLVIHGGLRFRETSLWNLDLDRGLDARGLPIAPVPLGGGQRVTAGDLRARTDIAAYAPGVGVSVKARIDWLDNLPVGGDPDLVNGSPATAPGQRPAAVVVRRAWAEALTPLGVLAAGRMGAHFGLGITANGGDCEECDKGDVADRVAFVAPIAEHLLAVAYDVASRGPFTRSRDGGHAIALEPADAATGWTLAALQVHSPAALARRAAAGRTSLEYGAYLARRTQDQDVPASYLPTATPRDAFTSDDLVARGFSATTTGGWLRLSSARLRIEAEVAYARARIDQPSLIPGAALTVPVTSSQLGAALESELTLGGTQLGVKAGYASGDDAPGFGAFPGADEAAPSAGAFDGPQADLPRDRTVDNFRFNADYRIDEILFREIIGTITDAVYLRPSARTTLLAVGSGRLEAALAVIASWAVKATSTPGGARALGVEFDPELRYASRDGFAASVVFAALLPGAGFDGTNLEATPAYALRARLYWVF